MLWMNRPTTFGKPSPIRPRTSEKAVLMGLTHGRNISPSGKTAGSQSPTAETQSPVLKAMNDSAEKVIFTPWVGPEYSEKGLNGTKLLVVGESHHGEEEDLRSGFTEHVVRSQVYNGRHRFFTIIAKLILGRGAGNHIPQSEREWVWDRVSFYNYVQSMAGMDPDGDVTDPMWKKAKRLFLDVVEVTSPDAMLVVGKKLGRHVPTIDEDSSLEGIESLEGIDRLTIDHVSRGFSYDPWMGNVQELAGAAPPSQKNQPAE